MYEISCKGVKKNYKSKSVLKSVSFSIGHEKIIGLIGRNGVGKSTLLKLLAGHLKPSDGEIHIFNKNPFNNIQVASDLVFIEDSMTFPSIFSLGDIFEMAKDFYPKWQDELAKKLLAYANISLTAVHQNLSKGQKSTFNLIYGLATRCKVTLLDEPMSGMDEVLRMDMYRVILKEYIAYPRTIVISSHHLLEIEHLLEDIILIDEGTVKIHAPIEEVNELLLRLKGEVEEVKAVVNGQRILFENAGATGYEVVIEKKLIDNQKLQDANVQVSKLTANEACNYLTNKGRGGIEDVFK